MKYKTEFSFKKAIIIDAQFLGEMQKQILNYCDKIDYEANLENGDNIKFESLEELILFENSKINKFKNIQLTARDSNLDIFIFVYIRADSIGVRKFYETISVSMTTNDLNMKTVFKNNMGTLFVRHEQSKAYNFLSRTGILNLISIAYFIFMCVYLYKVISGRFNIENNILNIVAVILIILFLLKSPLQKGQEKYFPPIVFYLGDEIQSYNDKKAARKNFFWGFIIAGILAICSCIGGFIISL